VDGHAVILTRKKYKYWPRLLSIIV